jgi:oligopeptide/dipeptide ABC transporter ATP-binding protein
MLAGEPPSPLDLPPGCPFHPRCRHAMPLCKVDPPPADLPAGASMAACHLYAEDADLRAVATPV